jgi:AcrR family transcriptional regulator
MSTSTPAASRPRRRLAVEDRRDELIAAALVLFSARPADEVTLDDIATQAGVSRALAYRYFGSRGEIYVAAMRTAADKFLTLLDPPHDSTPLVRIVEAIHRYFDFVEDHATGFQTLLRGDPASHSGAVGQMIEEVRAALFGRLVEGMGRKQATPELRMALRTWIAGAEAAALDWLANGDLDRRAVEDFLLNQLYGALSLAARADNDVARFLKELQ